MGDADFNGTEQPMDSSVHDSEMQAAPVDGEPKIIKRYANRKLYDTVNSRYVTLEEVAEMIKNGVDLQIVDNRTKEDLTSITLAQIIFEEEKRQGQMPLPMLKRIIQGGSLVTDFISDQVGRVSALKGEAENRVGRLFKRDSESTAAPYRPQHVLEVFSSSQRALEEWQRRVDERVRSAVESVTGLATLQRDLQRLHERLDALESKLEMAEARAGNPSESESESEQGRR